MSDTILPYKPQVSLAESFAIDENLPENQKAFQIFEKLKLARLYQDALFLIVGKYLKITRDDKLYKYWDFDTFEQFIADEQFAFSREKAYMCIRVYEFYSEKLHLKESEIQKIGITRLSLMLPLVKSMEDNEKIIQKIDELKDLHYTDFVKQVKDEKNIDGKPTVYWSEIQNKWLIQYFENVTLLVSLGQFEK